MQNNRLIGQAYEDKVCQYLIDNGLKILERNFHYHKNGEIDIIALDGIYTIFVEVKYRKNKSDSIAEAAVSLQKMRTISRVSDYYRLINNMSDDMAIRFDVVAVYEDEIRWYKNAFEYV